MASRREAIDILLKSAAPVVALVGDRIYFARTKTETAYPYIRYSNVTGVPDVLLDGTITDVKQRWQFSIFADDARTAEAVRDVVKAALQLGYTEVPVPAAADGNPLCKLKGSRVVTEIEPSPDPETQKMHCVLAFQMMWGEN